MCRQLLTVIMASIKKIRSAKAIPDQLDAMVAYMENHTDVANNRFLAVDGAKTLEFHWNELSKYLNLIEGGVVKTVDKWKKVWGDLKAAARTANAKRQSNLSLSGNNTYLKDAKSQEYEIPLRLQAVLKIIGPTIAHGWALRQEVGTPKEWHQRVLQQRASVTSKTLFPPMKVNRVSNPPLRRQPEKENKVQHHLPGPRKRMCFSSGKIRTQVPPTSGLPKNVSSVQTASSSLQQQRSRMNIFKASNVHVQNPPQEEHIVKHNPEVFQKKMCFLSVTTSQKATSKPPSSSKERHLQEAYKQFTLKKQQHQQQREFPRKEQTIKGTFKIIDLINKEHSYCCNAVRED